MPTEEGRNTIEKYVVDGRVFTVHPLAGCMPLIRGTLFDAMVADMRVHGLRRPILVTGPGEDVVVDGRNRLRAALEADVTVRFEALPADTNVLHLILRENVIRRHLSVSQRAIAGAYIRLDIRYRADALPGAVDAVGPDRPAGGEPRVVEQPPLPLGARKGDAPVTQPGNGRPSDPDLPRSGRARGAGGSTRRAPSQEWLSTRLAVSVALLRQAERLVRRAPDLAAAVLDGDISVSDAYACCGQPAGLCTRALADVRSGNANTLQAAIDALQAAVDTSETAPPEADQQDTAPAAATVAAEPQEDSAPVEPSATAATPPGVPTQTEQDGDEGRSEDRPGPGVDRPTVLTAAAAPTAMPEAATPGTAPAVATVAEEPRDSTGPVQTPAARRPARPGPTAGPASGGLPPAATPLAAPTPEQPHLATSTEMSLAPELVRGFQLACGGDIDLAICPLRMRPGRGVKRWRGPAAADLNAEWAGSVLAAPPVSLMNAFLKKLTSGRSRVAPAMLLAPLDPTDAFFDRVLDHDQLCLAVFERVIATPTGASRSPASGRLALYLFGVPHPSSELVAAFRRWGHVLLPRGGNPPPVAVQSRPANQLAGRLLDAVRNLRG